MEMAVNPALPGTSPERETPSKQLLRLARGANEETNEWEEVAAVLVTRVSRLDQLTLADDESGKTILHYACDLRSGAHKAAKSILDKAHYLPLPDEPEEEEAKMRAREEAIGRFIDHQYTNQANKRECAIHFAANRKDKRLVGLLISRGADMNLPKDKNKGEEAIRIIYREMPEVILELFDANLKFKEDKDAPSVGTWNVHFDFTPVTGVLPHYDLEEFSATYVSELSSQTFLLSTILHEGKLTRSEVLLHPLVQLFMHYKHEQFEGWIKRSIICHILWYVFSMIVLYLHFPDFPGGPIVKVILVVIYIIFFIATLAKEVIELESSPDKKYYWGQLENWGQWILLGILLAYLIVSGLLWAWETAGLKYAATSLSAIGIFTAGLLIMGQMNKTEWLGIYMEMLSTVMKNIAKFSVFFSPLLTIYAVIFRLLMPDREEFHFPWAPKVVAMLTGEIEYNGVFHEDDSKATVPFPLLTKFIFLGFAVTVVIVLQNLLIGLTVSDIQELKQRAKENHLAKQLEQIFLIENFLLSPKVKDLFERRGKQNTLKRLMVEPEGKARLEGEILGKLDLPEELRNRLGINRPPRQFEVEERADLLI